MEYLATDELSVVNDEILAQHLIPGFDPGRDKIRPCF